MQNVRFTVDATIEKVDTNRPWYFKKCLTCKQKIGEGFPHSQCKLSVSETNPNCRLPKHSNIFHNYAYLFSKLKILYLCFINSYCFRLLLTDETGHIYLTCFSNEANSMVKDCNDIIRSLQDKDRYKYPEELLALEGKKKIFQLHFASDSTKQKPVFFLDTAWDNTPLLTMETTNIAQTLPAPVSPASSSSAIPPPTAAQSSKKITIATSLPEQDETIAGSSTCLSPPLSVTPKPEEPLLATPPDHDARFPAESHVKYGPRKGSIRKALYSEEKTAAAEKTPKKTKKNDF